MKRSPEARIHPARRHVTSTRSAVLFALVVGLFALLVGATSQAPVARADAGDSTVPSSAPAPAPPNPPAPVAAAAPSPAATAPSVPPEPSAAATPDAAPPSVAPQPSVEPPPNPAPDAGKPAPASGPDESRSAAPIPLATQDATTASPALQPGSAPTSATPIKVAVARTGASKIGTSRPALAIAAAPSIGTVDQCSNTGSSGGDTLTCSVTITNDFAFNPATPNQPTGLATIVMTVSCTGSAVCPTGGTSTSTTPVTVITQCNNAGLGGASTVTCTVTVTNNLSGYPIGAAIDSTVSQCQSPGAVNTLTCVATPPGNSRTGSAGPGGQSVAQCNSSGGAGGTMTCTVTAPPTQDTGLPTTI
ncbi:MAG: hypothetical protein QOF65_2877, partial [Thermoleophilaceae bacterium]|nr:hypothetical protein [Thermoleophilaceae bacterium]